MWENGSDVRLMALGIVMTVGLGVLVDAAHRLGRWHTGALVTNLALVGGVERARSPDLGKGRVSNFQAGRVTLHSG